MLKLKMLVEGALIENNPSESFRVNDPDARDRTTGMKTGGYRVYSKAHYEAVIYGTSESGSVEQTIIEPTKLHTKWVHMSPKREEQFEEEIRSLRGHQIPVIKNGRTMPDYNYLRTFLNVSE